MTFKSNRPDYNIRLLNLPAEKDRQTLGYYDIIEKYSITVNNFKEIDLSKLYYLYYPGELIFDINDEIISLPYRFNYISSLVERFKNDPIYKQLITLLEKHPYVISLDTWEIPYYNSDFGGQKGIHAACVFLPRDVQLKLFDKCKHDKYWSVRMSDHVKMGVGYTGIYGDEIDELLNQYWDYVINP